MSYGVEIDQHRTTHCSCCGNLTRTVWGFINKDGNAFAIYYVIWTMAHVAERGATIQLILGNWGENSTADERSLIELQYRAGADCGVMVVDAQGNADSKLYTKRLPRVAVIGSPLAQVCFDLVDAIWTQDARVSELIEG